MQVSNLRHNGIILGSPVGHGGGLREDPPSGGRQEEEDDMEEDKSMHDHTIVTSSLPNGQLKLVYEVSKVDDCLRKAGGTC